MTKLRQPFTTEDAVARIMGVLTPQGAAFAVGKTPNLVRTWSDPDHTCLPSITQAQALDLAHAKENGGETPIYDVYGRWLKNMLRDVSPIGDVRVLFGRTIKEVGDIASKVEPVLADGKITPREKNEVLREIEEAQRALEKLARAVKEHSHER